MEDSKSNISKPTQIGLSISQKECYRNFEKIIQKARNAHVFVWLDMESIEHTDETIEIYNAFFSKYERLGIALQANLKRTEDDLIDLLRMGAKMKTTGEANLLARDIMELGRRLGIHTHCIVTFGEHPIGNTVGPALEAKEALEVLMNQKCVPDLIDKACNISGSIFELLGESRLFACKKNT